MQKPVMGCRSLGAMKLVAKLKIMCQRMNIYYNAEMTRPTQTLEMNVQFFWVMVERGIAFEIY